MVFIWDNSICDLFSLKPVLNFSLYWNAICSNLEFHALYFLSVSLKVSRFPVPVYLSINADRGRQEKGWIFILLGECNNIISESVQIILEWQHLRQWHSPHATHLVVGIFMGGKNKGKRGIFPFHIASFCHSHI